MVRCIMGMQADRLGDVPIGEHIAECARVIRAVAPEARALGLKVAVEDHGWGDLLADLAGILVAWLIVAQGRAGWGLRTYARLLGRGGG